MKAFWLYTFARLGVFISCYLATWLIASLWIDGLTFLNLWVLIVALVVSSVISLFALAPLRDALAARLESRASSINQRIEESRRAEDVD
ncbi:DUF4229 domain-containing protein [Aeromicrobium sp. YIM 150415]|mgnify:CR=1 FL=1|uniref:DUF4229 domain-containing protein n=1 Tax=Aeromicrobium piscarium TaxID=2590901 RepID=A0A554SPL0_9ACTN|nr:MULTISPECIES: DUF4229 domain-containing protein [Aeromicrobium]MBM9462268.1 DUF4229 domain-containing protein [Aeromicrobium sp. YIM 150415]TSD68286.1 DUF4229 domain-containing protein [Aeromicrobium piscarium]